MPREARSTYFLTSSFAAETYGWEGDLQNSLGGAEQPRMIELLVYNVGGQLVLGPDVLGGHVVLGPDVLGGHVVLGPAVRRDSLVLGPRVRGDISTGGHPVL